MTHAAFTLQAPSPDAPAPRRHEGLWWGGAIAILVAMIITWRIRARRARVRREAERRGAAS